MATISRYAVSHILVRLVATFNIATWVIDLGNILEIWKISSQMWFGRAIISWWLWSSMGLLVIVSLEAFWLRKESHLDRRNKELTRTVIDLVLVVAPAIVLFYLGLVLAPRLLF